MARTTLYDDDDDKAAGKAAEGLKKRLETPPPPDESVEVSVDEDDDDDDDDPEPEERKPTRAEKKRARYGDKIRENDELRQEVNALKQQNAMVAGYLQAQAQNRQQGPQADPLDAEIAKTYHEHERLLERARVEAQSLTPEQLNQRKQEWYAELNAIEQRRVQLQLHKAQRGQNPQALAQQAHLQGIAMQNADVFQNQQAYRYAMGLWNQKTAEGRNEDMDLVEEVLNDTRVRFRMPRAKRPQTTEKRQMAGISRGAAPGAAPSQQRTIQMTPQLRKIAVVWGAERGLGEAEAIKKWAKERGPGYLARVAERRGR